MHIQSIFRELQPLSVYLSSRLREPSVTHETATCMVMMRWGVWFASLFALEPIRALQSVKAVNGILNPLSPWKERLVQSYSKMCHLACQSTYCIGHLSFTLTWMLCEECSDPCKMQYRARAGQTCKIFWSRNVRTLSNKSPPLKSLLLFTFCSESEFALRSLGLVLLI